MIFYDLFILKVIKLHTFIIVRSWKGVDLKKERRSIRKKKRKKSRRSRRKRKEKERGSMSKKEVNQDPEVEIRKWEELKNTNKNPSNK